MDRLPCALIVAVLKHVIEHLLACRALRCRTAGISPPRRHGRPGVVAVVMSLIQSNRDGLHAGLGLALLWGGVVVLTPPAENGNERPLGFQHSSASYCSWRTESNTHKHNIALSQDSAAAPGHVKSLILWAVALPR